MAVNANSDFRPGQENVVHIGAGVTLKGEVSVSDVLVVDGVVEGDVAAAVVRVGPSGVIRGRLVAIEADVSGQVADHIEVSQFLAVRSGGRVEGRVIYGEIELEKGAVVAGDLSATGEYGAPAQRPAPAREVVAERVEAPSPAVEKSASAPVDRLNEAVRAARHGAGKGLAAETGSSKRNLLRSPLRRKP